MLCLIEFLDNTYQRKLRILSQGRSEQYEDVIEQYKNMFLAHLNYAKGECKQKKCIYSSACKVMKDEISKIEEDEIKEFFDKLKKIYLLWIDSSSIEAITTFNSLLKDYNLLTFKLEIKNYDVFFKGRISNDYLTKWDMFHIPFNKRHLIENQRYSLTGQPIVYIGKSVIDIVEELGTEEFEKLKISTVQLPIDMSIYDLRNSILDDLFKIFFDLLFGNQETTRYNRNCFFKMILSSVCSFPKRQDLKKYSFCEEYVLPQLLAQILKNENFHGIMYQSTKKFENTSFEEKKESFDFSDNSSFRENVALFTNINNNHVYDKELFEKINISVPININQVDRITYKDLESIKDEINDIQKAEILKNKNSIGQEKITKADSIVSSFNRIYNKMKYKDKYYCDTIIGQLHLYHLYEVLHQILTSEKEG